MSTFTLGLAIACLTTSNLTWFMDLTFQVPMQYCSLQHWTLLVSPVTSATGYCFCFGSILSFFVELFLYLSPVAYWARTDLGSSSFSILSFCLFILFMGFSRQEYWSGLPFPSPVDHILQTFPPWPARLEWPHGHGLMMMVSVLLIRTVQEKMILWTIFKVSYLNVGCLMITEVMVYRLNIS